MINWLKKNFSIYFLLLALVELAFVQLYPSGRVITKPLLMISLMAFYILSSKRIDWLFATALFFALLGDTFLLSDDYFLYGLGSFLVMQLLYAICFFRQRGHMTMYKSLGIGSVVVLSSITLYQLIPDLGADLKIPVITYSSVIGLMAIAAIGRMHPGAHYSMVLWGVISFLISDSLLGLNKFGGGFPLANLLVMMTYIVAQYLIVKGYLRYQSSNNAA